MVNRNRSVCLNMGIFLKDIADSPDRVNQLLTEPLVYLFPQMADPGFHDIRLRTEVVVSDVFHDHGLGHNPAGIAHQVFKKGKLKRFKIYLPIRSDHLAVV